jgi:hypothetical protein
VQQDQLAGRVSHLESELQTAEKRAIETKRRLDRAETELQVFRTRERSLVKELDLRQAELNVRAAELDAREIAVAHAEARVGARSSELDNREAAVADAEARIGARSSELDNREAAVADAEAGAEDRLRALREMESRAATADGRGPTPPVSEDELERHTGGLLNGLSRRLDGLKRGAAVVEVRPPVRDDEHLVVAADHGYQLVVRQGPAPDPGAILELNGGLHRCLRIGRSPFLGDDRRCAVLEPVTGGAEAEPSSEPLVE